LALVERKWTSVRTSKTRCGNCSPVSDARDPDPFTRIELFILRVVLLTVFVIHMLKVLGIEIRDFLR
jgi:hypothetical protein